MRPTILRFSLATRVISLCCLKFADDLKPLGETTLLVPEGLYPHDSHGKGTFLLLVSISYSFRMSTRFPLQILYMRSMRRM